MLDFRRHRRASKRPTGLEGRIVALVGTSALVVLMMVAAGNPGNWRWLSTDGKDDSPQRVTAPSEGQGSDSDDVIVAAQVDDKQDASPPSQSGAAPAIEPRGEPSSKASESRQRLFPGVRADYLSAVRDNTVFRPEESDAWFHLLAVLEHTSSERIAGASEGPVTYLQLDQQPEAYRGRLITIDGVVRAARKLKAPDNGFGVKQYYQLWLQPDRGAGELIALYCLELPERFPLGMQLDTEATATGFFFKRWAYPSQGGIATAPLVIARTIDWQPPSTAAPVPAMPPGEQLLMAAAVALLLAVVALALLSWRSRQAARAHTVADATGDEAQRVSTNLASLEVEPRSESNGPEQP